MNPSAGNSCCLIGPAQMNMNIKYTCCWLPNVEQRVFFGVLETCWQDRTYCSHQGIGHFTVVYLVAKPLIWSEAEGDLVVLETRI